MIKRYTNLRLQLLGKFIFTEKGPDNVVVVGRFTGNNNNDNDNNNTFYGHHTDQPVLTGASSS